LNSEDLKDGLEEENTSDTIRDGEPGDGEEPIEDIILDIVEEYYGGEDAGMFTEEDIITTDTTTGLEPGDINTYGTEDWNKIIFSLYLLISLKIKSS